MIHLFVEFRDHHRLDDRQKFGRSERWHAESIGQRQRRRHVPADNRAGKHTQLAAETADEVPDLPAIECDGSVQPRRAVPAGLPAGLAVSIAPTEGPFGEGAETFFSCSRSKPLET